MLHDDGTETHTLKSITFGKNVKYEIEVIRVTETNNETESLGYASYDVGSFLWDEKESGFIADFEISNRLHDMTLAKIKDDSGNTIGEEVTDEEDLLMTVLDFLQSRNL